MTAPRLPGNFVEDGATQGRGISCVAYADRVLAFDPNEGVFVVPVRGWAAWVNTNLLSGYPPVTLMTVTSLQPQKIDRGRRATSSTGLGGVHEGPAADDRYRGYEPREFS